ncbi:hypothetical protein CAPTEDRAFT_199003 [Capitella teleta]|uniref:G-protein coupled receptors family 1 profile domain-containing protein n=1 Tax=Capitella teleta TaxID=283909 RepID=R7TQ44_CAPTE|nr:hypothetical protein CAPTEDRAFT_199003 [Capitella teleta]|eukprot:ELT95769.1 hypothetical protein CAPTEDRAFT_199003 [Capitella teleta]
MDKQLQSVSNYFLLSLSVADFAIGLFSMPLYTVYLLMNQWPLGSVMCDLWLAMDYTTSNASVANLIIISVDRYLSVTRPLTYRAKRTPKRAAIMITFAWAISAVLWTPWIVAWPYIEGKRTVPDNECFVQFLQTNPYITIVTAVAAFYLPVAIMCFLYFKIYQETEKRQKGLAGLQAGRQPARTVAPQVAARKLGESSEDEKQRNNENVRRTLWMRLRHCCHIDRDVVRTTKSSSTEEDPHVPDISIGRSLAETGDALRAAMQARINARMTEKVREQRARRKRQEKKQEKKAAKTLSAILLAFVITWTPYNVFTIIHNFCPECINPTLYAIGYWLCYLNSTVNPVCYALCNANFRRTYWNILTCRWVGRKHRAKARPAYYSANTLSTR